MTVGEVEELVKSYNKTQNKMTTLEKKLNDEILAARKAGDKLKANLLLTIKGQVQNAQKDPEKAGDIDAVINAAAKSILKGLDTVTQTEETEKEKVIAKEYLPQLMTASEVANFLWDSKNNLPLDKLHTPAGIGPLTGILMKALNGKADGKTIKEVLTKAVSDVAEGRDLFFGGFPGPKEDLILETEEDKKIFSDAILNPPPANEKLKRAQANHAEFIKTNNISVDPLDGDEGSI